MGVPWVDGHRSRVAVVHCVDALTGVDGTALDRYLDDHWLELDAIAWVADPDPEVYR